MLFRSSFSIRACLMGNKIPSQPLISVFDITEEEFKDEVGKWRDLHPKEWESQIKPMDQTEQSTFTDKDGKQITLKFGRPKLKWPTGTVDFKSFKAGKKKDQFSDRQARGRISRLVKGLLVDLVDPETDLETEVGMFLTSLLGLESVEVQSALEHFFDEWTFKAQYEDHVFGYGDEGTSLREWPSLQRVAEQEELDFFYNGKD